MISKDFQSLLLKSHFVNSRISKTKIQYFKSVILPQLIEDVNSKFNISYYWDLKHAFSKSPLQGIFNSLFDPNQKYFNSTDLAVAINISINGFCNERYVNNKSVASSADFLCEKLQYILSDDLHLFELLRGRNKDLKHFDFHVNSEETLKVLSDQQLLFNTYFERFNNSGQPFQIRIYHQSPYNNWLECDSSNSLTINHNLVEFQEGFFLTDFDYQLGTGEWLNIASSVNSVEYFNPDEFDWYNNVIWAR